ASRRRHTISKRDWSSDVCSSDLDYLISKQTIRLLTQHFNYLLSNEKDNFSNARYIRNIVERAIRKQAMRLINTETILAEDLMLRSEERRVGKECRTNCWRNQTQK